jgi:hypothetical protein
MDVRYENEMSEDKRKCGTNCSWTKICKWNDLEAWLQDEPIILKYIYQKLKELKNKACPRAKGRDVPFSR